MKHRYRLVEYYEKHYPDVEHVMQQSCGYPDHSMPTHTLRKPPAPTSHQSKNSLSKIDRELAAYFHPTRR